MAGSTPDGMTRKLYVKSYGCQMNVYDSHRMADTLAPEGYVETATPDGADLIILNTCHIREKAAEKVYSELGRMRELKDAAASQGRRVVLAVAGCVAQAEGKEIIRRARHVDLVFGPQSYHRLPDMLARAAHGKVVDTEFPAEDKFDHLAAPSRAAMRQRGVSAFVTVQEGCDKFCTFCVVPYTRGAEVSRPVAKIVAEAERLADAGVREITLIGQNVNAYHGEGAGRPRVDARRSALPPRRHAGHRAAALHHQPSARHGRRLIAAHRDLPALMPQLHLPVQSGSDRILAAMNRRHTRARISRRASNGCAARGPTSRSRRTSSSASRARPRRTSRTRLRSSPRSASPAPTRSSIRRGPARPRPRWSRLPEAVKDERLQRLQARDRPPARAGSTRAAAALTFDVLFEKTGRALARSSAAPHICSPCMSWARPSLIGEIHPVTVTEHRQLHAVRCARRAQQAAIGKRS